MTQGIDAYYIRVSDILQDRSRGGGGGGGPFHSPLPKKNILGIYTCTGYKNILSEKVSGI